MKNRSGVSGIQMLLIAAVLVGGIYLAYWYMHKPAKTETPATGNAKTIITLLGAPGAGKGTLAANAQKELGVVTLSTGNLVREEIAKDSEIGKQFKQANAEGKLVADEVIFSLVKDWLLKNVATATTIILDGFPRTATQAALLTDFIKNELKDYSLRVIELQMSEDEAVKRAANRLICENKECQAVYSALLLPNPEEATCEKCGSKLIRREDDREEVVRARLVEYAQANKPLVEFYRSAGFTIETIPADKPSEEVFAAFKTLIAQ